MPDKNGKGPRQRSPYPSKRRGGRKKGKCSPAKQSKKK